MSTEQIQGEPGAASQTLTDENSDVSTKGPAVVQSGSADGRTTIVAQPVTPVSGSGATETGRGEVSAVTIARMMGLATATEFKFLEGKLDLLSTKVNAITARLEKAISIMNGAPTGSDLERIDVQIGALKTIITESLSQISAMIGEERKK